MTLTYIALGSNLENPKQQVISATEELATLTQCELIKTSRLYLSKPMGPQDQSDFINRVVALETNLLPLELLDQLQGLEQLHARVRKQHWGPRTLDLDLLLYGEQIINHPRLTVPHPGILERDFVLQPLAEIAPEAITLAQKLTQKTTEA